MNAGEFLKNQQSVLVIIPAYNEADALPHSLEALKECFKVENILVVDDGSVDNTSEIAKQHGVNFITLPFNLGVGGAIKAGLIYAERKNYDIAIQFDADLQHKPEYIPKLIDALGKYDLVIGSRFFVDSKYEISRVRKFGSVLLSQMIHLQTGLKITDPTSGFRANSRRAISVLSENYPTKYLADTVESIIISANHGLLIGQINTPMESRQLGIASHNPMKASINLLKLLLVLLSNMKSKRKTLC